MFFVLSKLLAFFTFPSNLAILIGILGLLLLTTRFARTGRCLAFVSLIVLAILGFSPMGNALIIPWRTASRLGMRRAERRTGSSSSVA